MSRMTRPMVEVRDLNVSFGQESIYEQFSMQIDRGEKVAITGESGKGKSTLLLLLAGFIPDYTGDVSIDGLSLHPDNIKEIRKRIAWLPQETSLNFNTVNELLYAPFDFVQNKKNRPRHDQVLEIFDSFGLSENLLQKRVKELSGGQKQRVLLASCMLMDKPILLIDEPTSALDLNIKKKVTDHILQKNDVTVIAATHDEYWIEHTEKNLHLS